MCGKLESFVSATEKVQKVQAKEYEKIVKVSRGPALASSFSPYILEYLLMGGIIFR